MQALQVELPSQRQTVGQIRHDLLVSTFTGRGADQRSALRQQAMSHQPWLLADYYSISQ